MWSLFMELCLDFSMEIHITRVNAFSCTDLQVSLWHVHACLYLLQGWPSRSFPFQLSLSLLPQPPSHALLIHFPLSFHPQMSENTQHSSFCVWIISLHISSSYTHFMRIFCSSQNDQKYSLSTLYSLHTQTPITKFCQYHFFLLSFLQYLGQNPQLHACGWINSITTVLRSQLLLGFILR